MRKHGWTEERTDGQRMDGWTENGRMDRGTDGRTDVLTEEQTEGQGNRRKDGGTDR
jgi:hypothetical protein